VTLHKRALGKDAGLCCGSRLRSGEVFAYVGRNQNLKDLKGAVRTQCAPRDPRIGHWAALETVPCKVTPDIPHGTVSPDGGVFGHIPLRAILELAILRSLETSPLPRTISGPYAKAYCRVLGGDTFLRAGLPCRAL